MFVVSRNKKKRNTKESTKNYNIWRFGRTASDSEGQSFNQAVNSQDKKRTTRKHRRSRKQRQPSDLKATRWRYNQRRRQNKTLWCARTAQQLSRTRVRQMCRDEERGGADKGITKDKDYNGNVIRVFKRASAWH